MLLAFCKIVVQSCIQLHRWKDYALSGVGFLLFAGAILVCVYATLLDLFAYSHGMADQILTVVCVLFMGWVGLCLFIKALKEWKILPAWFPPCSAEEKKAKEFLNGKKKQKQVDTLFASKDVTIAELKKALEDPPRHMETQLCPAHIWCTLPSRTALEPCVICPSLAVRGGSPPVDTQSISIRQPLNLYRDVENTTEEAGERQEENIRQLEIAPDFDTTKYTLGALCQRRHAWGDTEQSLLHINNSRCLACELFEFKSFAEALCIVSAYGNVLATFSPSQTYSPMTQLPVSKEDIRRSINLVYAMLGQATIREDVKHWYPEHAERLLSETFSQSLREVLASLPFFITDEELAFLTEMAAYGREARVALQENRPCVFDIKQDMEKMIITSFISDITNIRTRVLVERQQYLTQLEQEREGLAVEVKLL